MVQNFPETLKSSIKEELLSSSPLSQVNSANFVFLYHGIKNDKDSQDLYMKVGNILKSSYGRNKLDIPSSTLESMAFLKTYLRDFLLGGTAEEKELLGFTLGNQGSGKTSVSLSLKKEVGTMSEKVIDENTGETLELSLIHI